MNMLLQHCQHCGAKKEIKRAGTLPRGWKRFGEDAVCADCWAKAFVLRAVTFPVAGPLDPKEWPELREALSAAWADTTALANWTMTEMVKADVTRMPGEEKMPKMKPPYLYPQAVKLFPRMSSQTVAAVLNTAQAKYMAARYEVVWTRGASLPTFRYPVPAPFPAQGWKARWLSEDEHVPIIKVFLQKRSFELRLRGGLEFRRQLDAFSQLVAGEAKPCEMALYRVSTAANANRTGVSDHNENGSKQHSRVMCKLVMWLPRKIAKAGDKTLMLARGRDCLWTLANGGGTPFVINADHVRRWVLEHRDRLHRLSQDTKAECRMPHEEWSRINDQYGKVCKKQHHRLDTFCHQASLIIAEHAARCKAVRIVYDATATEYLPSFPWFQAESLLEYKLRERGIAWEKTAAARMEETT